MADLTTFAKRTETLDKLTDKCFEISDIIDTMDEDDPMFVEVSESFCAFGRTVIKYWSSIMSEIVGDDLSESIMEKIIDFVKTKE